MGRVLLATDLYTKQSKAKYDFLLNKYYEYLSIVQQCPSKEGLIILIDLCKIFLKYNINCEVIVYDTIPMKNAFGHSLEYLGIDVVHEMSESLLSECVTHKIRKHLNENGLCTSEQYARSIVPLLDHGNVNWEPCYVYSVKF